MNIFIIWLMLVVIWNFGYPQASPLEDVAVAVILSLFSNILTNAIVLPGITVGEGAVVGAGAVLGSNAEPWSIYLGNPARKIKTRKKEDMIRYAQKLIYQKDSQVGQI